MSDSLTLEMCSARRCRQTATWHLTGEPHHIKLTEFSTIDVSIDTYTCDKHIATVALDWSSREYMVGRDIHIIIANLALERSIAATAVSAGASDD